MIADKPPPHNIEAEQAVLGSMLLERDAITTVSDCLGAEDFCRDAHRRIYETIIDLFERGEPVDLVTVTDRLRDKGQLDDAGGAAYVTALLDAVPTAANVAYYANIVNRAADQRAFLSLSQRLQAGAMSGQPPEILEEMTRAALASFDRPSNRTGLVEAARLRDEPVRWLVDGLLPQGMLALLSGRDKRGKTLLALEIVRAVLRGEPLLGQFAVQPGPVAAFLLDDPEGLTRDRLNTLGIRHDPRLFVSTSGRANLSDPAAFLRDAEREVARIRPALVVLDALYLFVPPSRDAGNDQARMAPVMGVLNGVAERTGATVLVIAHDTKSGIDVAGSHVIRAAAKVILRLLLPRGADEDPDEAPTTPLRVLRVESKLAPAASWALELQGVGRWVFHGTQQVVRAASVQREVAEYLTTCEHKSAEEIARAINRRRAEVEAALHSLLARGEIAREPVRSGGRGRPPIVYRALPNFRPELFGVPESRTEIHGLEPASAKAIQPSGELPSGISPSKGNQRDGNSGKGDEASKDDGRRRALMVAGEIAGFPEISYAPGRSIAPGMASWEAFCRANADDEIQSAWHALGRMLEGPADG